MTPREWLDQGRLADNDAGAKTPREYFRKLLKALWEEGDSFSGKRPFGNSGWDSDLFDALPDPMSGDDADQFILEAIACL